MLGISRPGCFARPVGKPLQFNLTGARNGIGPIVAKAGCLGEQVLRREIADMKALIDLSAPELFITQDLGLGMMLWMTHFCPDEEWAVSQRSRCLRQLEAMWQKNSYFCREPELPEVKIAFTNYGVSVGLQAVGAMPQRAQRLNQFFDGFRSRDEYDREAITHVMACSSHFPGFFLRDFCGSAHAS